MDVTTATFDFRYAADATLVAGDIELLTFTIAEEE